MRALGEAGLPETVQVQGRPLRLVRTVKHDFHAATGFYGDDGGVRAVVKVGRDASFAGLPLWRVGRWLCRREMRFYERLADVGSVPALLGAVGRTGFAHAFVPGRPLAETRPVPDGYFDLLQQVVAEVHRRGIAYVDANKPENFLVGNDGRPYLIDFQISVGLGRWARTRPGRWWIGRLQQEDVYHVRKHKRRLRPDELTAQERALADHRSPLIRTYRVLSRPYFLVRRPLLRWLRRSGRLFPSGSN
jgi:hypothetical protein